MTSDRSTERIIDLLYGELSPDEEAEVRAEIAETADLRADLDGYESLIGRIREVMPHETVSKPVHDSILEAARAAANQPTDARIARRPPEEAEPRGIWRRLTGGQGSQIALVAVVLIAGAFVVKFVEPGRTPMAPASDISSAAEPMPAAAPQGTPVAAETAADEAAAPLEELAEGEEPEAIAQWEESELKTAAGAALDDGRLARDEDRAAPVEPERPVAEKKDSANRDYATRSGEKRAAPRTVAKREAPAKPRAKKKSASVEQKPSDANQAAFGIEATNKSPGVGMDSRGDDKLSDLMTSDEKESRSRSGLSGSIAPSAEPTADYERQDQAAAPPAEYQPPKASIAAVDTAWRVRDYRATIAAADEFTQKGAGSYQEKAHALHLKAQSMVALGQYSSAVRVFDAIEKNYPNYKTNEIKSGRAEAEQRLRSSRKQRKAAPKKSYERADEPAEMDAILE